MGCAKGTEAAPFICRLIMIQHCFPHLSFQTFEKQAAIFYLNIFPIHHYKVANLSTIKVVVLGGVALDDQIVHVLTTIGPARVDQVVPIRTKT